MGDVHSVFALSLDGSVDVSEEVVKRRITPYKFEDIVQYRRGMNGGNNWYYNIVRCSYINACWCYVQCV
jgi:hypothetical protein